MFYQSFIPQTNSKYVNILFKFGPFPTSSSSFQAWPDWATLATNFLTKVVLIFYDFLGYFEKQQIKINVATFYAKIGRENCARFNPTSGHSA